MELTVKQLKAVVGNCFDTVGMYPLSVTKLGVTINRTDWQSGFNYGVIEIVKRIEETIEFFEKSQNEDLLRLLELDLGWWKDNKFRLNMNDTFSWACADSEDVDEKDYKEILRLYDLYGYEGLIYWVSEVRGELPNKEDMEVNYSAVLRVREKEKLRAE